MPKNAVLAHARALERLEERAARGALASRTVTLCVAHMQYEASVRVQPGTAWWLEVHVPPPPSVGPTRLSRVPTTPTAPLPARGTACEVRRAGEPPVFLTVQRVFRLAQSWLLFGQPLQKTRSA